MSLAVAIEAVYDAFSDAEKPLLVKGCPCCLNADEYEALTAKPLRELSSAELTEFAFSALLTMGTVDGYLYFLPRILELTIESDSDWLSPLETSAQKIRTAGFEQWNEKRKVAINELWLAVIRHMVTCDYDRELVDWIATDVETWLCSATLIPIPTEPLTSFLDAFPDVVREIYNQNFTTIFQGRLDNSFLSEPSQGQAEIATWLRLSVEKA